MINYNALIAVGININCFEFLNEAMKLAQDRANTARHVTGQELAIAFKDHAINQFGGLAKTVLAQWGIHCTLDIGLLVFKLIAANVYSQEDEDNLNDFNNVYDFETEFSINAYMKRLNV